MKIRIMIWGLFLIVGAIVDQDIMPSLVSYSSNLPKSIQETVLSELPQSVQTNTSLATSDMNSGFDQMRSHLASLQQYVQIGSISMGLVGVGLVTYGGLTNKDTKVKTNDTLLEILKKRLAKGEITKKDFDSIKQDIQ